MPPEQPRIDHSMPGKGRPWVKGQSGNPAGRRKSMSERCSEALEQKLGAEEMADYLDRLIRGGSEKALIYALNRFMGMPAQAIQISGDAERPLHGLIGVMGREMGAIEAPARNGEATRYVEDDVIDVVEGWAEVPAEGGGGPADEEEPDDTGGP